MFVIAIHSWKEETPELVQTLATALGILAYEARQRLIGGGPAVVASFADHAQARELAQKLIQSGIKALVIDATAVRARTGQLIVRRFELGRESLQIETVNAPQVSIPYGAIDLLMAATSIVNYAETKAVTERKLSIGKTMLAGGIPVFKKVETLEEVTVEERGRVLYLYAGDHPPVIFVQNGITYDGLGPAMQLSRELNFSYLSEQLRLLSSGALFDNRLINRLGQVRLLGPALNPETNLDLAAAILARCLRPEARMQQPYP